MSKSHPYLERYKMQLVGTGHIPQKVYDAYKEATALSNRYLGAARPKDKKEILAELTAFMGRLDEVNQLQVSRLLNIDTVIIDSVNAFAAARKTDDSPASYFQQLLEIGLEYQEPQRTQYYKFLASKMDALIISTVDTMHPTHFGTDEVRAAKREVIHYLEQNGNPGKSGLNAMQAVAGPFIGMIQEFAMQTLSGEIHLVPMEKPTVEKEDAVQGRNVPLQREHINTAFTILNETTAKFIRENAVDLSEETKAALVRGQESRQPVFATEEDRKRIQMRTWANQADADGRPEANMPNTVASTEENIVDGKFIGTGLDARQNSAVIKDCFSALIQLACQDEGSMLAHAERFFKEKKGQTPPYTSGEKPFDHTRNLYQQLAEEDKVLFAKFLFDKKVELLTPVLKKEIEAYKEFERIYREFLREKGMDVESSVKAIADMRKADRQELHYRAVLEIPGFIKLSTNKDNVETAWNHFGFMESTIRVLNDYGKAVVTEDYGYKVVMLDTVRRLGYFEDVRSRVSNPAEVCDRHQMANFENASDFYNMMHLMHAAGLIKIENGIVVNDPSKPAPIAIMPLLETIKDMEKGGEIFRKLLNDPLVKSMFMACGGTIDLMVGFSDGAKSGGNLASEMSIYDAVQEIAKLAKEHGLKIRLLQGRGPSPDRGGQLINGHSMSGMPDEYCVIAEFDVTKQADLHTRDTDSPGKGERQAASEIAITLKRAVEAEMRTPEEKQFITSAEDALRFMKGISGERYETLVKNNEDALDLIFNTPKGDNSSRPGSRNTTWNGNRAIGTEHSAVMLDMSMHNVGLKESIQAFRDEDRSIIDKEGKERKGMDALQYMYDNFDFFRVFVEKQRARVANHDAVIAESFGEVMGIENFVSGVNQSIQGLGNLLSQIATGEVELNKPDPVTPRTVTDIMAHALLLANHEDWKAKPTDEKYVVVETIRNAVAVVNAEHQNLPATRELANIR